jgi:hypothetical protein
VLASHNPKLDPKSIRLEDTYTNVFVKKAQARLQ